MPTIALTDSSLNSVTSDANTPALVRYLQSALVFAFRLVQSGLKGQAQTISELDANTFPLSLAADAPGGSFNVSDATLTVKGGGSASIDLLKADKKQDFLSSLKLDKDVTPDLMSFAFGGNLQGGPTGTVGDFSFGLTAGQQITITNYCPAQPADTFQDAARRAISGVTIPHDFEDLRNLAAGHFCRLEGKGTLTFTVCVQYNFVNNVLASEPIEFVSETLSVKAKAGPTLTVTLEHSDTHQITIASLGGHKIRIAASLTAEADVKGTLDLSIGVSGKIGSTDALPFILQQISPKPEDELKKIRQALPPDQQADLSGQIKKVLAGATQSGITASISEALEKSRSRNHLFVYDVNLDGLDAESTAAVEAALRGDFTQLTSAASVLAGITEVESLSTLTLTTTHTLTIHLLGILNCSDVSSFVQKSKPALNSETGDVVLTCSEIKLIENNVDSDHLREVLLRSAMITTAAASSPRSPDFDFKMVFFLTKASPGASDVRQFVNVLRSVSSPETTKAAELLKGASRSSRDLSIYLSLNLKQASSLAVFQGHSPDDYVLAGQNALRIILTGDEASANRLRLCSVSLDFWKQLRDKGNRLDISNLLQTDGITDPAAVVDFFSIDWWAQAMAKMAIAISKQQPLKDAQKEALKQSQGGFDIPWALLATRNLAGSPEVDSKFTIPSATEAGALTAVVG